MQKLKIMLPIAVIGLLAYLVASTADDDFLGGTDAYFTDPAITTPYVESQLGQPLPAGVIVNGIHEGGFQDPFVQIKPTAPESSIDALYAALGVDTGTFRQSGPSHWASDVEWWTIGQHDTLMNARATFRSFSVANITVATDPNDPSIIWVYLFAHQT